MSEVDRTPGTGVHLIMWFSLPLGRYASRRFTRRLTRELPLLGGIIVLITVGAAIRRKGMVGGTLHTTLDFVPFVGLLKNVAEAIRGRDFFPDKPITDLPRSRG